MSGIGTQATDYLTELTDTEKAYKLIKNKIITLEMPPGSLINQNQLMDELNLGRTPVREALKLLEAESLVEVVHRRGMSVAEISITDPRHIFEIRIALEGACARLAAERVSEVQIKRMKHALAELESTDLNDKRLVIEREAKVHMSIAECSESRFLQEETEHYYGLAMRIWYLLVDRLPADRRNITSHVEMVAAIEQRDGELAERLMREHLEESIKVIREHLL